MLILMDDFSQCEEAFYLPKADNTLKNIIFMCKVFELYIRPYHLLLLLVQLFYMCGSKAGFADEFSLPTVRAYAPGPVDSACVTRWHPADAGVGVCTCACACVYGCVVKGHVVIEDVNR